MCEDAAAWAFTPLPAIQDRNLDHLERRGAVAPLQPLRRQSSTAYQPLAFLRIGERRSRREVPDARRVGSPRNRVPAPGVSWKPRSSQDSIVSSLRFVRTALAIGDRELARRPAGGIERGYPCVEHALVAANAALCGGPETFTPTPTPRLWIDGSGSGSARRSRTGRRRQSQSAREGDHGQHPGPGSRPNQDGTERHAFDVRNYPSPAKALVRGPIQPSLTRKGAGDRVPQRHQTEGPVRSGVEVHMAEHSGLR